jgi:hypothetical protein
MRRALLPALALAAALVSCTVDVEGAACTAPGSTANCPTGQACGTGLTCSTQAASCTPCTVDEVGCSGGNVATCSAAGDPACGTWTVVTACQAGLQACMIPLAGGAAECACATWTVDPGAGGAACTRPSITSAIGEAVRFPAPMVKLGGSGTSYGNSADDTAPIVIPAGVTLIGDDTASAAATNRIIAVQGPGPEGLQVHTGASVRGLAVQRGASAGPTVGVLLAGGAAAAGNTLVSVRVDAGGAGLAFATGLRVAGANAVAVGDVRVLGATVAGLEVNRLGATDVVVVTGSTFDQNQVGVSLLKGDLTLAGTTVKRSVAEGVVSATGSPNQTSLAIADGVISSNGRGGVRLSVNDTLSMTGTRICNNNGVVRSYAGENRLVGGVIAVGDPPAALTFRGNFIHGNQGDQVYVGASNGAWDLSGLSGCAASNRNVIARYTAPGVGVAAVGAAVKAVFNSWNQAFPVAGIDFFASTIAGGSVDAGTGSGATDVCGAAVPADLTCPSP